MTMLLVLGLGSLSQGAEKDQKTPDKGVMHTIDASVTYSTGTSAGTNIMAERQPGYFTVPAGQVARNFKYYFVDPKSNIERDKLNNRTIYCETTKRWVEIPADPAMLELPPGDYKFVVGGTPGASGTLNFRTFASTVVAPPPDDGGKPKPPTIRKPPRDKPTTRDNGKTSDGVKPPGGGPPVGGEEVLLLLPDDFDVLVPEFDYEKDAPSFSPGSRRGPGDGPLVLRFRNGAVTAEQQWSAFLIQKSKNPYTVEYRHRVKVTGTLRRGVLQAQMTYYYEGGIRAIQYPEWQSWNQCTLTGQANADGKMSVQCAFKPLKSLRYDFDKKTMVDNPAAMQPCEFRLDIQLPVGQLQSNQKLRTPAAVPPIPELR